MDSYHDQAKEDLSPEIVLHFATAKHAEIAVGLLENQKLHNSKIAISKIVVEDKGRRLNLKVRSFNTRPSEVINFVSDVANTLSKAQPLIREVTIPLMRK
ncbi:MAG: hypothetical protein ACPLKZ_00950 [Candidatus Bathyarchaeales archaeon]